MIPTRKEKRAQHFLNIVKKLKGKEGVRLREPRRGVLATAETVQAAAEKVGWTRRSPRPRRAWPFIPLRPGAWRSGPHGPKLASDL